MLKLSPRQAEIADMVGEGLTEVEIAARLGLTLSTIKNHKQAIYHKLGVRNAVELTNRLREAA